MSPPRPSLLRRGLFDRRMVTFDVEDIEQWKQLFASWKFGSAAVDDSTEIMRAAAEKALADAGLTKDADFHGLEGVPALAAEILQELRILQNERRTGDLDHAIYRAMLLTQRWMELRTTVMFEDAVVEKQRRRAAAQSTTTPQILAALRRYSTFALAAGALNMSAREIRNRIPRKERDAIRKNRKL